jgi:hypothetical protein
MNRLEELAAEAGVDPEWLRWHIFIEVAAEQQRAADAQRQAVERAPVCAPTSS